jgi:DNA-directed RNA polymerase subunit H (RpoH/RPB5)
MSNVREIYNAQQTLCSMMIHQGYEKDYLTHLIETDYETFRDTDESSQDILKVISRKQNRMCVAYICHNTLSDKLYSQIKNETQKFIDLFYSEEKIKIEKIHIILVFKSVPKVTKSVILSKLTSLLSGHPIDLQIFSVNELSIDIMKSNYTPRYVHILSKEEEAEFLDTYKITVSKMPQIWSTDPLVRYFNAKPGNIIKCGIIVEESGIVDTFSYIV